MNNQVVYVSIITHPRFMLVGVYTDEKQAYQALFRKLVVDGHICDWEEDEETKYLETKQKFERFMSMDPHEDVEGYNEMVGLIASEAPYSCWSYIVSSANVQ